MDVGDRVFDCHRQLYRAGNQLDWACGSFRGSSHYGRDVYRRGQEAALVSVSRAAIDLIFGHFSTVNPASSGPERS